MATAYGRTSSETEACRITRLERHERVWYLALDDPTGVMIADIRALPWRRRNWNPKHGEWIITDEGMSQLAEWYPRLREQMDEVLSAERQESAKRRRRRSSASTGGSAHQSGVVRQDVPAAIQQACAVLYVTPDAPYKIVRAAYRALAMELHPDVGGDTAAMKTINAAFAAAGEWAKGHAQVSA